MICNEPMVELDGEVKKELDDIMYLLNQIQNKLDLGLPGFPFEKIETKRGVVFLRDEGIQNLNFELLLYSLNKETNNPIFKRLYVTYTYGVGFHTLPL